MTILIDRNEPFRRIASEFVKGGVSTKTVFSSSKTEVDLSEGYGVLKARTVSGFESMIYVFDIAIIDVDLPDSDGMKVAARLSSKLDFLPFKFYL